MCKKKQMENEEDKIILSGTTVYNNGVPTDSEHVLEEIRGRLEKIEEQKRKKYNKKYGTKSPEKWRYPFIKDENIIRWRYNIHYNLIATLKYGVGHYQEGYKRGTPFAYQIDTSCWLKFDEHIGSYDCTLTLIVDKKVVAQRTTAYRHIMDRWIYEFLNILEEIKPNLFAETYEESLSSHFCNKEDRDFYGELRWKKKEK
jgi:hypothetical protein